MAEEKAKGTMEVKAAETEVKAMEQAAQDKKPIYLLRSSFTTRDGRKMWSYYITGKKYGRDMKAEFTARDPGGFGFLDMLFDIADKVELVMHDEMMEGDNGRKTYYTVYEAQGVAADGEIVSIKIRPKQDSDKAYLAVILNQGGGSAA